MWRTRSGGRIIGVVVGAAILATAGASGWLRPLTGLTSSLLQPVGSLFTAAGHGLGSTLRTAADVRNLAAQNAKLEDELAQARQQLAADAELRQQNQALRQQLNFGAVEQQPLIPAEVIGYQPDNFRAFITIGRGTRDGIKVGEAVVSQGSLVGRVSDASPTSARIQLVLDPDFKINGLDQNTRADGTVQGQVGSGMVMSKIAQSDSVKAGDTIITSGLGGDLPKGLIVGQVESVSSSDNDVFQTALLVSGLQFSKLELVFVVVTP